MSSFHCSFSLLGNADGITSFFASYIGAEQARIVLQLGLNAGYDMDQIRDLFESPLRDAIYDPYANQEIYF